MGLDSATTFLCRILSRDVALQLLDGLFVIGDDPADQITNRYHANHGQIFNHWKVTNAMVRHNPHALVYGLLGRYQK